MQELRDQVGDARPSIQQMVAYIPDEASRAEITELAMKRFGRSKPIIGSGPELVEHYRRLAEQGIERVYAWFCDFAAPESLAGFGAEVIGEDGLRAHLAEGLAWNVWREGRVHHRRGARAGPLPCDPARERGRRRHPQSDICGPVSDSRRPAAVGADELEQTVKAVEALGRRVVWDQVDVRDLDGDVRARRPRSRRARPHRRRRRQRRHPHLGEDARAHPEQWQDVIDVNLTGVCHTVQCTLPHLLRQGTGGSIILTSSFAALKGTPFTLSYTAAKYGVIGIAKAIAHEYGDYNIRANIIHPCGVNTVMGTEAGGLMELVGERAATVGPLFMNTLPVPMIEPEDVSATVAWLASDDSKYVTGAQIPVDAGAGER